MPRSSFVGGPLKAILPKEILSVVGVEKRIFYENTVLTLTPDAYTYDVQCSIGVAGQRYWSYTPVSGDAGTTKNFAIVVRRKADGMFMGVAKTTIRFHSSSVNNPTPKILLIGDSNTDAGGPTNYPSRLTQLLTAAGVSWTCLGSATYSNAGTVHSQSPSGSDVNVKAEGWPGKEWEFFTTSATGNPFWLGGKLDCAAAITTHYGGVVPTHIVMWLGTNMASGVSINDPDAILIPKILNGAERLIGAWRRAAPGAKILVACPPPGHGSDSVWTSTYGSGGLTRKQHMVAHRRMVERYLTAFQDRQVSNVWVMGTHLGIDPLDDHGDAVHLTTLAQKGYSRMADDVFGWFAHVL